jgi:hypothetical protein
LTTETTPRIPGLTWAAILLAALTLSASVFAAPADGAPAEPQTQNQTPPKPRAVNGPDRVAGLTLASRLAEEGRKNRSALTLAAAAEIMAGSQVPEVKRGKTVETGPDGASTSNSPMPISDRSGDPQALFVEAAAIAREDSNEPLAAAIESAALTSLKGNGRRGARGRGESHSDRVMPHSTDIYNVRFPGGVTARATVVTGSGQDVDLFVFDQNGSIVAYDNGLESTGACTWVPEKTGEYSLRVSNTTGVSVDYTLFTN